MLPLRGQKIHNLHTFIKQSYSTYLKFSEMNDWQAAQADTVVLNKYSIALQKEQNFKHQPSMDDKVLKTNEVEYNLLTWSDQAKCLPHAGSLGMLEVT